MVGDHRFSGGYTYIQNFLQADNRKQREDQVDEVNHGKFELDLNDCRMFLSTNHSSTSKN